MKKNSYIIKTHSPEETVEFAHKFSALLKPNDVITLYGDLAAGKTTFTKGVCKYFNADQDATSPTFTLINEYHADLPIFHFDCYRIKHPDEIIMLGFDEYLEKEGVVLIEWPEKIGTHIPEDSIELHLEYIDDKKRRIEIRSPRLMEL
ncbi:MAG: tRNA (adenosine(37)-N6)-threonylcarbamoyltransferase complex ATPase subunit type 1 TsaE [Candidatus Neomarinimicrobiota bacterium]|jgi:tRNA threonylcarbamoyladenosine biosynthesis protein TsaE